MNILIDAHMVGEQQTGNETYIVNLSAALQDLGTTDTYFFAVTDPDALGQYVRYCKHFRPVRVSSNPATRLLADIPAVIRNDQIDVAHFSYFAPPFASCPFVLTIHDIAFKRNPNWFSPRDRVVLNFGVHTSIRRARAILTVSNHAKSEICSLLHVPEDMVKVTYEAAGKEFTPASDGECSFAERRLDALGVSRPYFLAVGNLQPRKNLRRLLEAFSLLKRSDNVPHKCVLAGQKQWGGNEIKRLAQELGIQQDVVLTGFVNSADIRLLYHQADVFVYPSLYEGFGLPILEAMASGTPVVTSNAASMPEVAGDAAVLVDPSRTESIADGIRQIISDKALGVALRARGAKQARSFSWLRTAEQTHSVYRDVVANTMKVRQKQIA